MIENIKQKKEFRQFKQFFRYKDFLVCRLEPHVHQERDTFGMLAKPKKPRYMFGDVRVLFEVVPCDKVSLCGQ
jgi:hypothetical protein